ncbi:hypothetical protein TRIUR3_09371 [Triticum urartu]|uniref:KIB1-4 beta-propeller domain-containing protein n=1 Tax=Triticum urartu TaxID=4572 RepID=M7YWN4_TRIUA|nr:hypothetical protein TRIUR3_09371 [Triticum urartu]
MGRKEQPHILPKLSVGKTLGCGRTIAKMLLPFDMFAALQHWKTKFKVVFEEDKTEDLYSANEKAWLVVCGDALLLIKRVEAGRRMRSEAFQFMAFKLESLDAMTKKARWVKVNKLDNWAIFISVDERCEALPCMNPEGWGGRSNHIYFPSYLSEKPWAAVELWQKCYYRSTCSQLFNTGRRYLKLESTWVFPARFLVPDCEVDAVGD